MCTERPVRVIRQRGLTLVELIVFIIIVSIALTGILSVLNFSVMHSADPMVRKQAIAIAEALMEEVTLHPFTYCEPTDANLATAAPYVSGHAADPLYICTAPSASGKSRYTDPRFDNVNNYAGFVMNSTTTCVGLNTGICDVTGISVGNLAGYSASVAVNNAGVPFNAVNGTAYRDDAVQRIDVTVSRGAESVTLTSYRFRYAPNSA